MRYFSSKLIQNNINFLQENTPEMTRMQKKKLSNSKIAETAFHIERNILNHPIGKQDDYITAFGGFNYINFAKDIIKNSKVKLFLVNDNIQLANFLKRNMYGKKIVIGMGAGTISNWMRKLPELM